MSDFKTKIIANYLPQFHTIPENDEWWGKGFTDWKMAQKAEPLYKGHYQPRVPLNNNYYDLSDTDVLRWQAYIAKKYGIYGFGIYHYWFNSNQNLLTRPAENLLKSKDIEINFMFIWDNSSWSRTWSKKRFSNNWVIENKTDEENKNDGILAELIYGDEHDWKKHFEYMLPFFNDSRYIKINNKPIFYIYNQNNNPEVLKKMIEYWDVLAKENGFDGLCILGKRNIQKVNIAEYQVTYEPGSHCFAPDKSTYLWFRSKILYKYNKWRKRPNIFDKYDDVWKRILDNARTCKNEKIFYSGVVDFDDTARRANRARIIQGATPSKFKKYLSELIKISIEQEKEYIFITAWNEWGEGAYLEPDERYKYAYLEAVRDSLKENDIFV